MDSSPPQVSLEWPLESVSYTVRGPSQHELQPPPGGPGTLSLHFPNPQEAQRWAALVQGATVEGQNGQWPRANSVGQRLYGEGVGVGPPPQAWVEEVAGKSGLTLPTAGLLGRLLGERKWREGTETKS